MNIVAGRIQMKELVIALVSIVEILIYEIFDTLSVGQSSQDNQGDKRIRRRRTTTLCGWRA